ncbi:SMC-Scp complex subunit ScpB [Arcanobacterium haemolyticum]|nr:SMC-Scp complex subunit ScpB [Arcanobacterium haemolyticum]
MSDANPGVHDDENDEARILGAIEALVLVAAEPMTVASMAKTLGISQARTESYVRYLAREFAGENGARPRGFQLREVAGGWRLYTNPDYADVVAAHVVAHESGKLTMPALETLAVIAYRQPVTRAQIAAIRGVSVDSVVRTLQTRGLIDEVGLTETTGAILYGTTPFFLEAMGINSLDELAPLAPYLPEASELDEVAKELQ